MLNKVNTGVALTVVSSMLGCSEAPLPMEGSTTEADATPATNQPAPETSIVLSWTGTLNSEPQDEDYGIHDDGEQLSTSNQGQALDAAFDASGTFLMAHTTKGIADAHPTPYILQRQQAAAPTVHLSATAVVRGDWREELTWQRPRIVSCDTVISEAAGECVQKVATSRHPVTEIWQNRKEGLEQSFVVHERPSGSGDVAVHLDLQNAVANVLDGGAEALIYDGNGLELRYSALVVTDRNGVELPARMEQLPGGIALHFDDSAAAYPVIVDPLVTTASWVTEGNSSGAFLGQSVHTAGDVNNDGFDDLIVGAPWLQGSTTGGRAFVFHGNSSGLSLTPNWSADVGQANARFSWAVSGAGDVNGDGFDDVIVGARNFDNGQTDEGAAFVYHGTAAGLLLAPAWSAESDQVAGLFGTAVAGAGDVNGDGFDDVIVGARNYDAGEENEGHAFVYLGSASGLSTTPAWIGQSDQAAALYGIAVAGAGDVNDDGFDDVIVGAEWYDSADSNAGRVFLYLGGPGGPSLTPDWTGDGEQADAQFGHAVGGAGDVNGDGFDDVVVGANTHSGTFDEAGRAYVYLGSGSGLSATPTWTADGEQENAHFGHAVAQLGDVNNDGFNEVVVGAPDFDVNGDDGRIYVYLGSSGGPSAAADWQYTGSQEDAHLGYSVAPAGDVNGDSNDDLAVGQYAFADGQSNEGRALVFHGGLALNAPAIGDIGRGGLLLSLLGSIVVVSRRRRQRRR